MSWERLVTKDNEVVPGVTTIMNVLNKPALVKWANELGLKGIKASEYNKKAAALGVYVHKQIEDSIKQTKFIMPVLLTKEQLDEANNCFKAFNDWYSLHNVDFLFSEQTFVSEKRKFGGIVDSICTVDNEKVLIDFKTTNKIVDEYWIQLAAYVLLLNENNILVDKVAILRLPKDGKQYEYEEKELSTLLPYWYVFDSCHKLYNSLQTIRAKEVKVNDE